MTISKHERRRITDFARNRLRANHTAQLTDDQVIEMRRIKANNQRLLDRIAALDDIVVQLMREIDERSRQIVHFDEEIRQLRKEIQPHAALGRQFNVSIKTVEHILSGRTYRHLPVVSEIQAIEE